MRRPYVLRESLRIPVCRVACARDPNIRELPQTSSGVSTTFGMSDTESISIRMGADEIAL